MSASYTAVPLDTLSYKAARPGPLSSYPSTQSLLPHDPIDYDEHKRGPGRPPPKPWVPFMLRRWVLLTIALVLLALIASLEIVLKSVNDQGGFGPINSNLVYIWTYGPTAVFTLVAAFWTQVDYRTRHLQPWRELARMAQPAPKHLFLDYISPNPVVSLMRSLKHRHWPVASVLLGSGLLKVIIILSTGLFTPRFSTLPVANRVHMIDQFQFEAFNASKIDAAAVSLYTSLLHDQVSFPSGTNANFVAERFESSKNFPLTPFNVTTRARTITAGLECDVASMNNNVKAECPKGTSCRLDYLTMDAETKDCRISQFPTNNRTLAVTSATETNLGEQDEHDYGAWWGDAFVERCDGDTADDSSTRLVIVSLYKQPGPVLANSTTLFCKPAVNVSYSTVTYDQSERLINVTDSTPLPLPSTFSANQLNDGVRAAVDWVTTTEKSEIMGNYTINNAKYRLRPFIGLILLAQDAKSVRDAYDPQLLSKGADAVFRGLVTQIARQYVLIPNTTNAVLGEASSLSYVHQRLFIQDRTLRLIEVLLVAIVLIVLFLVTQRNAGNLSQDTASIARFTSAIMYSSNLNAGLIATGTWPLRGLRIRLQGSYHSRVDTMQHDFRATQRIFKIEGDQHVEAHTVEIVPQHWRSMVLSWYFRAAVLAVPLILIIALEVLFRHSQRFQGLLDVTNTKDVQIGTAFVPALIMALSKLLFSSFDFDLRIIDPYIQLKNAAARAKTTVLDRTIYTWKTDAFWIAMTNKRFSVGASALSVMLASFLTVAVSGLYATYPVAHTTYANIAPIDSFGNFTDVFRLMNASTLRTSRLAAFDMLDESGGTFHSYVVPSFQLAQSSLGLNVTSVKVSTQVRSGNLTCESVPQDKLKLLILPAVKNYIHLQWPEVMVDGCTGAGIVNVTGNVVNIFGYQNGSFAKWETGSDAETCPSAWGVWGTWAGHDTKLSDLSVIQCWAEVQETSADIRFSIPDWRIQWVSPEANTTKTLARGYSAAVRLESIFQEQNAKGMIPNFDATFSAFLRTSTPNVLDTQLLKQTPPEKLFERIQKVYGAVVAQALTSEGRNTSTASLPTNQNILATATIFTLRLQQYEISTRILQGLLAAMFVCALISVSTLRLTGVLPKNPCSIAALASLVAGSKMMANLPPGSQYMDDKEFDTLFKGQRFMLGWSSDMNGVERFGIDVDDGMRGERRCVRF